MPLRDVPMTVTEREVIRWLLKKQITKGWLNNPEDNPELALLYTRVAIELYDKLDALPIENREESE